MLAHKIKVAAAQTRCLSVPGTFSSLYICLYYAIPLLWNAGGIVVAYRRGLLGVCPELLTM